MSKKSKSKFEHLLCIPADIVKELELSESIVELKIKDGSVMVKKVGETLESIAIEGEENKDYTIHY